MKKHFFLSAFLGICLITLSGCGFLVSPLVEEGDRLLVKSDFGGAEEAYQQAISRHPGYAPAYAHLSYLHSLLPQTRPKAIAEAEKAVKLDPKSSEAHA